MRAPAFAVIALLTLLTAGCRDPFEDGRVTLTLPARVAADGASVHEIEVCVDASHIAPRELTLVASGGAWLLPSDPSRPEETSIPVRAEAPCAVEAWVASDVLRPVRFRVLAGDALLARDDLPVDVAVIESVELLPAAPFLAAEGESTISLRAEAIVRGGANVDGRPGPTVGTRARLTVISEPAGAAAVDDAEIIFGEAETRTLFASAGVRRVTVTVRSVTGGDPLGELVLTPAP